MNEWRERERETETETETETERQTERLQAKSIFDLPQSTSILVRNGIYAFIL